MANKNGRTLNLHPAPKNQPNDAETALGVPDHPGTGRFTEGVEELFDEDYARLNGAQSRIDQAQAFFNYVMNNITKKYHLEPGKDLIHETGRILRAGRDNALIAQAKVR